MITISVYVARALQCRGVEQEVAVGNLDSNPTLVNICVELWFKDLSSSCTDNLYHHPLFLCRGWGRCSNRYFHDVLSPPQAD